MTKNQQHKIEYAIVRTLIILLNLLPLKLALRFGDLIGFIAFSILRVRRRVSLINLKHSFGDKYTAKEYKKIALKSYINFARSMIEFGLYPKLLKIDLSNIVKGVGEKEVLDRLNDKKSVTIVSGHLGNFELAGAYMTSQKWPVDFLVGKQRNLLVNDLMNRTRSIFNANLIEIGVTARAVFASLKKGRGVIMLSDQDSGDDGVIVNFLGRLASTPKGPAAFALKTGSPIVVFAMIRDNLAHHTIYFDKLIYPTRTGDKEQDIKNLTQAYTDILAKYIAQYPEFYFWAHRRWKSTCPGDY